MKRNDARIGDNSNDNAVFQECTFDHPNIYFLNTDDPIEEFAKAKNYQGIQKYIQTKIDKAKQSHPLFPNFTAEYNSILNRLISTPQTEEALKKYPKKITGKIQFNYSDFPGMVSSESIIDYAYRTQTKVKVPAIAYEEYLGEEPDPYPFMQYEDGLTLIICPPEFPEARDAQIIAGKYNLPIKLRRIPCKQFGVIIFEGKPLGHDVQITIRKDDNTKTISASIERLGSTDLKEVLISESFLSAVLETKKITLTIEDSPLCDLTPGGNTLTSSLYQEAPYRKIYAENLLKIQEKTGCKFTGEYTKISSQDYANVLIMAKSLEGESAPVTFEMDFDNRLRMNFNDMPSELIESDDPNFTTLSGVIPNVKFEIMGQHFIADRYVVTYIQGKINNLKSVKKNFFKKRNNVVITIKPQEGKKTFYKVCLYEALTHLPES